MGEVSAGSNDGPSHAVGEFFKFRENLSIVQGVVLYKEVEKGDTGGAACWTSGGGFHASKGC